MIKITGKRSKTKQYVIGTVVAVIILCVWISIPLMQSSSMDSSVASGNFFKTRTADIGSLGSDIPQEGGAPGYALDGEMLNNPATFGENIASSLFQSGPEDETATVKASAADSAGPPATLSNGSASAGAPGPSSSGSRGKLNVAPSGMAGNSNSMTAGGAHGRFFGSGAAKTNFAPVSNQAFKNATEADKRNTMVAMLQKTGEKSAQAAKSSNLAAAASGAAAAFGTTSKGPSNLNTDMERGAAASGLALDAAAQDLKRNDPQLNKKNVTLPEPNNVANTDEQIKMMLLKMMMQIAIGMALGPGFGAMAGAMPMPGNMGGNMGGAGYNY